MRRNLFLVLMPLAAYFFFTESVHACAYSFVGSCSSDIGLRINGTPAVFSVADCPSGTAFQGTYLGAIQSMSISYAFAITWESCQNNVTGVTLCYRLTQEGGDPGEWRFYHLKQDSVKEEPPYTTRYRSGDSDADLTNGLAADKNYVLEIYFRADIDTIGDDFVPETVLIQNNGGRNYAMSFRYGGASAPPFLAVPAFLSLPTCFGKKDGSAGVAVFGPQAGLSYKWSGANPPIPVIYGLSAGLYTVTVSNGNGTTQILSIPLKQPDSISIAFPIIQPLGCNGEGYVLAASLGGTPPYTFQWSTGSTTAGTNIPSSDQWTVSVTDARSCPASASVNVPPNGTIKRSTTVTVCEGETYQSGGQSFTLPGTYTYTTTGSACDTTVTLTLKTLKPSEALASIPGTVSVSSCNGLVAEVCGNTAPGISYLWKKNGNITGITPCFTGLSGNMYSVTAVQTSEGKSCEAHKDVTYQSVQGNFSASIHGLVEPDYCKPGNPLLVELSATTNAANPSFEWIYNGQIISTTHTCTFTITVWQLPFPVLPILIVKDGGGCQTTASNEVLLLQPPAYSIVMTAKNTAANQSNGSVVAQVKGGIQPFKYLWSNGATTPSITQLPPGIYCLTVTDVNNCTRTECATVTFSSSNVESLLSQKIRLSPNPLEAGGVLQIELPMDLSTDDLQVEIIDITGNPILCDFTPSGVSSIGVRIPSKCSSGFYVLRIAAKGRFFNTFFEFLSH